ncbi:MAG TPA: LamG-like jellyroll fold domain-containing protein [Planctomycetota bacterium]|nr:LamG-like jellyroll fold domain-containing protein [Planctomycetota bacterium]
MVSLLLFLIGEFAQDSRIPVPSDLLQSQAEKTIREVFKAEYGVSTPTARQKLAQKLVQQGIDTNDDPALRYILFREAADLASRSGDLPTLQRSLDEISNGFLVDALSLREAYLTRSEPAITKPEDLKNLAEAQFRVIREAISQDQFDVASRSALASVLAAKKAKDIAMAIRADAQAKAVSEARGTFEKARKAEAILAATPDDPTANQARGEYLCFCKGDWGKGLVFLSKGSDAALQALATKELAAPAELPQLVEIADGWWDVAGPEKSSLRKSQLFAHVRALYEHALPDATGLVRLKIEKRLAELKDAPGSGFLSETPRNGLVAWWKCDEGRGTSISDSVGSGTQGTLVDGVEWTSGLLGTALKFNGKTSYVSCKGVKLPAANAPQTISWWHFYAENPNEDESIMTVCEESSRSSVQPGFKNGRVVVWQFGGGILVSAPPPSNHAWHHFAYSYDGTQHRLYVDGKLADTSGRPAQSGVPDKCEFGRWVGGKQYFSGLLREVRMYSRALADAEISGLAAGKE